jgi:YVTN family beta-propeller protein
VIQTASNTVTSTIAVGARPYSVAFSPDGTLAHVANFSGNTVSVIQTASNTVTSTILVGSGPTTVDFSPDGTRAYVSNYVDNTVSVISVPLSPPNSQAAPIPTLSEWAMIMMASLMGMFAFVRIRRS